MSTFSMVIIATNAAIVARDAAGKRKRSKAKSREKIDGLVALAMALGGRRHEPQIAPYCFTRGPLVMSLRGRRPSRWGPSPV
jgi:hypothetical protein